MMGVCQDALVRVQTMGGEERRCGTGDGVIDSIEAGVTSRFARETNGCWCATGDVVPGLLVVGQDHVMRSFTSVHVL